MKPRLGLFDELKEGAQYEVAFDRNLLSLDCVAEIKKLLLSYGFTLDFPPDWQWVLRVEEQGEYVGSLTKRIGKYLSKTNQGKLSESLRNNIGNIITNHTPSDSIYYLDFTQNFDWSAGDFEPQSSCYWDVNYRHLARSFMSDCGFWAVRFYCNNKFRISDGLGRAWIAPFEDHLIMFNPYMFDTACPSAEITHVLKKLFGCSSKTIMLSNNEASDGYLWINQGAGTAFGSSDVLSELNSHIDLQVPTIYCDECCEEIIDNSHKYEHEDNAYCERCFPDRFSFCNECDRYRCANEVAYRCGRYICYECWEKQLSRESQTA